jgi:acyl carrier protein
LATVFERVKKVTMKQLGLQENEVFQDSNLSADLGADSLDQVEMMIALEEEFSTPEKKVSIPDEESEKMLSIQDVVDYLHSIGISDIQAQPRQPEKAGFPHISLPRPGFVKPSQPRQDRQGQPRPSGQNQGQGQGQGQNRPAGQGQPRGNEQRRDNRPRHDRRPGNQQRQNFTPRPPQQRTTTPPAAQPPPTAQQPPPPANPPA